MGKIYKRECDYCGEYYEGRGSKFCSFECSQNNQKEKFENVKVTEDTKKLYEKILHEIKREPISVHNYFPKNHIKIGLLGDNQIGSIYARQDILDCLYNIYKKEGINHVYNTGDLCDGGNMYRGHEFELINHGVQAQVECCLNTYPRIEGITTHFITGNHDLSFYKSVGVDIGEILMDKRKDFDYLGREEADINIQGILLRLAHPGKGTSYAVSYQIQKMIESITGGTKPNILAVGHFHKAEVLPLIRNITAIQTGTTQSQTPFMRRNSLAAHLGGWILEFWVNGKEIVRIKTEFIPFYEK